MYVYLGNRKVQEKPEGLGAVEFCLLFLPVNAIFSIAITSSPSFFLLRVEITPLLATAAPLFLDDVGDALDLATTAARTLGRLTGAIETELFLSSPPWVAAFRLRLLLASGLSDDFATGFTFLPRCCSEGAGPGALRARVRVFGGMSDQWGNGSLNSIWREHSASLLSWFIGPFSSLLETQK